MTATNWSPNLSCWTKASKNGSIQEGYKLLKPCFYYCWDLYISTTQIENNSRKEKSKGLKFSSNVETYFAGSDYFFKNSDGNAVNSKLNYSIYRYLILRKYIKIHNNRITRCGLLKLYRRQSHMQQMVHAIQKLYYRKHMIICYDFWMVILSASN